MSIFNGKLSEADQWRANEACGYYENKMAKAKKPLSKEAKAFYRKGYEAALLDADFVIISFLEEDFTSQGFKREQFSAEVLKVMLNALTNLYLSTKRTLKRDLAKELVRNEAANLKLKPKPKR